MKNQRSSTFSSPYDSYLYSQDSIEMNTISLSNQQKAEESPFQKLRGHTANSFHHQSSEYNHILNTSPFQDNTSSIGLPISYLNIAHNPSIPNSSTNSNYNQPQDLQSAILSAQFIQSEEVIRKKKNNKQIDEQGINENYIEHSMQSKFDDQNTQSEINSAIQTGTFGGSLGEDTQYQSSSYRMQKELIPQKYINAAFESPYSHIISTDYKTSQSLNDNIGSLGKSNLTNSQLGQFTPSPLKQTNQQTQLTQSGKQQYDYKLLSPFQNNTPYQYKELEKVNNEDQLIQNKIQIDVGQLNTLKSYQNENQMMPALQTIESGKQFINHNSVLNGNQTFNYKTSSSNDNSFLTSLSNQNNTINQSNQNNLSQYDFQNKNINFNRINGQINPSQKNNNNNINQAQFSSNNTSFQNNVFNATLQSLQNMQSNQQQKQNDYNNNNNSQNESQFFLKKQFTFQQQKSIDTNDTQDVTKANNTVGANEKSHQNFISIQPQKVQNQLKKFSNSSQPYQQGFDPSKLITNQSEHISSNQSVYTPQKNINPQLPQTSMNEFYEQMLQSSDDQIDENQKEQQQQKQQQYNQYSNFQENICGNQENEKENIEKKQVTFQQQQGQTMNDKVGLLYNEIDRLSNILNDSEKNTQDQQRVKEKLQSEKDHLLEFVKNMEIRNKLLNERIQLLESNLQSLNSQNIENIDKIVNLNAKIQDQEKLLAEKNIYNQNVIQGVSLQSKELQGAAQRQDKLQQEIQQLVQKDLKQEKKILELMSNLNKLQSIRNEYDKVIAEQQILVKNTQNNKQTIDELRNEIARLQNITTSQNQDQSKSIQQAEKALQQEKIQYEAEIQKLLERNKTLEEHVSTMKVSCQKLEAAMTANCNSTKEWLEKYNSLEKNYLNLQNQFRSEQQKQLMEKNNPSKRDILSIRSQQSLNRFKSELSETELNIQFQKNHELIHSEVQNERDLLSMQNEELKEKIKELSLQNNQIRQKVQLISLNSQKQFEENERQRKDLLQKLNLMIEENTKLINLNNERPHLLQKVQQLTQQLDYLKSNGDNGLSNSSINNLENSLLSLQPPTQFNSPIEEAKWFKLKCNKLEVKLKVKNEEYAEVIYQNKLLKKQVKVNPQEQSVIKSSLYQTIQPSNSSGQFRQASQFQQDQIHNIHRSQIVYENEEESRGCCDRRNINKANTMNNNHQNNNNSSETETDRDSVACNVKCI